MIQNLGICEELGRRLSQVAAKRKQQLSSSAADRRAATSVVWKLLLIRAYSTLAAED